MKYQATGDAITKAIITRRKKSFESKPTIPVAEAPSTLRIPISFVLRTTTKAINPQSPIQQMKMDITANALNKL